MPLKTQNIHETKTTKNHASEKLKGTQKEKMFRNERNRKKFHIHHRKR